MLYRKCACAAVLIAATFTFSGVAFGIESSTAPSAAAQPLVDCAAAGPVLLYFHAADSAACRTFEESVALDETLPLLVDGMPLLQADVATAAGARLAAAWSVSATPTLIVLQPAAAPVRLSGVQLTPRSFALALARVQPARAAAPLQFQTPKPSHADMERLRAAILQPPPPPAAATPVPAPAVATPAAAAAPAQGVELGRLDSPANVGKPKPAPGLDLKSARVSLAGSQLLIDVEYDGPIGERLHVLFDADSNPQTGFASTHITGAELMIEGVTLYRFAGPKTDVWQWEQVGTLEARRSGSTMQLSLPLAQAGLKAGQTVRLALETFDDAYATADDSLSATGAATFRLPNPLP